MSREPHTLSAIFPSATELLVEPAIDDRSGAPCVDLRIAHPELRPPRQVHRLTPAVAKRIRHELYCALHAIETQAVSEPKPLDSVQFAAIPEDDSGEVTLRMRIRAPGKKGQVVCAVSTKDGRGLLDDFERTIKICEGQA